MAILYFSDKYWLKFKKKKRIFDKVKTSFPKCQKEVLLANVDRSTSDNPFCKKMFVKFGQALQIF